MTFAVASDPFLPARARHTWHSELGGAADDEGIEIVLVAADSLETIRKDARALLLGLGD
jgi:hypothetical protein